jgi:hypothetical protein
MRPEQAAPVFNFTAAFGCPSRSRSFRGATAARWTREGVSQELEARRMHGPLHMQAAKQEKIIKFVQTYCLKAQAWVSYT